MEEWNEVDQVAGSQCASLRVPFGLIPLGSLLLRKHMPRRETAGTYGDYVGKLLQRRLRGTWCALMCSYQCRIMPAHGQKAAINPSELPLIASLFCNLGMFRTCSTTRDELNRKQFRDISGHPYPQTPAPGRWHPSSQSAVFELQLQTFEAHCWANASPTAYALPSPSSTLRL